MEEYGQAMDGFHLGYKCISVKSDSINPWSFKKNNWQMNSVCVPRMPGE
jgi:hypothetical protein